MSLPPFDPDFSSPREIAEYYRLKDLNPIPAKGKRPAVDWKDYQNILVPQAVFEGWYNPESGTHKANGNVGTLLGRGYFMVDLDTYKPGGEAATNWYNGQLAVHNNRQELETWEQTTGAGGRQLFFKCPHSWRSPNVTTKIFVDVKGDGGFAMLPPSLHDVSKKLYKWRVGRSPDDIPIMVAPQWLCEEIDRLDREQGGGKHPPFEGNGQHHGAYDDWGRLKDGREDRLTKFVWGVCCDWRRVCPIKPTLAEQRAKAHEKYAIWEGLVTPQTVDPGKTKTQLLEEEERGPTEFWAKFQRAMDQWDGKLREEADKPPPKQEPPEEPKIDPATGKPLPIFLSSAQFVAGFVPPDYLVDGIIQCGFLYSLTARTNHGKTSVCMYVAQSVARSAAMHYREVKGGTVLFFAGENPDDIRMRFLTLAEVYGFDPDKIKIRFKPGIINIHERFDQISAEADTIDDLVLVIVDTAAAYFTGDDTNNNNQQGVFARQLRRLTTLRGKPAVIVNCHPIKNAARDNLLPMGGSAFVNEVDGNLTLWANGEKQTSLHWLGKFRGPEFDPVSFDLVTASTERVKDAKGRLIPSVVAKPISEITLEASEVVQEQEENRLLTAMHDDPRASFTALAGRCGFVIDGRPLKTKVSRLVQRLAEDKMLSKHRGGKYRLTQKGRREIGVESENDDD